MTHDTHASSRRNTKLLALLGMVAVAGAVVVLFVLPAETGSDPLGTGAATGLDQMADPPNEELTRGMARMERQQVLALSDTAPAPAAGISDSWEVELAPFESIEFKYTLEEGRPIAFSWEAGAPVHYDLHAHPFEGGTALTESYAIGEGSTMQGTYTPAFTGEHGWYWENRSADNVTVRLTATGPMTSSNIYGPGGSFPRPIEGATDTLEGQVQGHQLQEG